MKKHSSDELLKIVNKPSTLRSSFFSYFGADEKDEVVAILEQYKKNNHKYHPTIVKIYGENYDKLNIEIEITKEEKLIISRAYTEIKRKIKTSKDKKARKALLENSFEIKDNLEPVKRVNTKSPKEKLQKNDSSKLEQGKKKPNNVKTSYFDYFPEADKWKVTIILNAYKKINHKYYKTISHMYGENFDKLNTEIEFTKKEMCSKKNATKTIRKIIDSSQTIDENFKIIDNRGTNKTSFFDYFDPEDKEEVAAILEEYKKTNHKYYAIIKKWYGENYDELNTEIEFTKEDKTNKHTVYTNILKKLKKSKNQKAEEHNKIKIPKVEEKTVSVDNNEEFNIKRENKVLLQTGNHFIKLLKHYVSKYPILSSGTGDELLILMNKLGNYLYSDEEIGMDLRITMEKIDSCYIKYLIVFEDKIPEIICSIIRRRNYSIDEIIEQSFLKDKIKYFSEIEKQRIYLKLKQYKGDISVEEVRTLLSLIEKNIETYEMMSMNYRSNKIHKLVKK